MKLRIKIALVAAIAAALAAVGAGWKWNANAPYKIADGHVAPPNSSSGDEQIAGIDGWSWGDD